MGERGAGLAEQQLDVVHRLLGLAGRVTHGDALAGVQILRDLAAQVHGVTRDHGLAQVVVEVLLGVGVARC